MKIKKNIILITFIIFLIFIISAGTYAFMVWYSQDNTELTMKIGSINGCIYNKGPDINISNLGPVFDYETDGEYVMFNVENYAAETFNADIILIISQISNNLAVNDFKYVVQASNDKINYEIIKSGDFSGVSNNSIINLYNDYQIASYSKTNFKIIFYIDGNKENSNLMHNGNFVASVSLNSCE